MCFDITLRDITMYPLHILQSMFKWVYIIRLDDIGTISNVSNGRPHNCIQAKSCTNAMKGNTNITWHYVKSPPEDEMFGLRMPLSCQCVTIVRRGLGTQIG